MSLNKIVTLKWQLSDEVDGELVPFPASGSGKLIGVLMVGNMGDSGYVVVEDKTKEIYTLPSAVMESIVVEDDDE